MSRSQRSLLDRSGGGSRAWLGPAGRRQARAWWLTLLLIVALAAAVAVALVIWLA
jgi:hypothetical protein